MNFELDEFGLDEPLLEDVQHQSYASFLLDQPLDLFDELNQDEFSNQPPQTASSTTGSSSGNEDSYTTSSSSIQLPVYRRDSSDESDDVGIVDDVIIQQHHQQQQQQGPQQIIHLKRSLNESMMTTATTKVITLPPNAFIQPTVIKLEPLVAPQTPVALSSLIDDSKPQIAPKPCLVISSNGALTPFSLQQAKNTKLVNVKDIKMTPPPSNQPSGGLMPGLTQQQHDEMERQAKRQMRIIKNREAATLSRQRQKAYLESLEERVRQLARENEQVKHENEEMKKLVERLHEENQGLRGGGGSRPAFSTSSSMSSPEVDLSPVSSLPQHDSPQFITAAPSPPQVIDLDDEPVPKKILIKPAAVITLPVSVKKPAAVNLIPTATISRDTKQLSFAAKPYQQQQQPTIRRVLVAATSRPNSKVLLVFSLIFAFNCIPFASRFLRESSTTNVTPVISSPVSELSYLPSGDNNNLPSQQHPDRILDGGRILYKTKRSSESHDLMILPPRRATPYFEYDVIDDSNDLPLMDDSVLGPEERSEKCPTSSNLVNVTESQRIVNVLSHWASLQQRKPADGSSNKMKPQTAPLQSDQPRLQRRRRDGLSSSSSSDLQLYRRRSAAASRHHEMLRSSAPSRDHHGSLNNDEDSSSLAQYEKFAKTIRQQNDTFYMVSFHVDQLIFPALVVNRTTRPKMSLILPALFSLNETVSPPEGSVALMQIECEISDMKVLHLGKHLIPLDVVMRHMRDNGAHADATNRMYRQWLYGKP